VKKEELYHKVGVLHMCSFRQTRAHTRAAQGSDASNAHDEEVGEHEQASVQPLLHLAL
jgi:hypothetical protein